MSEEARNTISVRDRNVQTAISLVFAKYGASLYALLAIFVIVSTGIRFLRTNMPIFTGGEIESGDLLSSRMMTETLLPMVYQAFDKFGAIDAAEEETNE